jgi:hypothetical protein
MDHPAPIMMGFIFRCFFLRIFDIIITGALDIKGEKHERQKEEVIFQVEVKIEKPPSETTGFETSADSIAE